MSVAKLMLGKFEGPLSGHKLDCPVIVSADNVDYQQSYSRVYSGTQSIGWHGTTVQITLSSYLSSSQQPTPMESSADIPQATCYNDTMSIGTNFKRTHRFLLESCEALYRVLMRYFLSKTAPSDFLQSISALLQNFPPSANQGNANRNLKEMIDQRDSY